MSRRNSTYSIDKAGLVKEQWVLDKNKIIGRQNKDLHFQAGQSTF